MSDNPQNNVQVMPCKDVLHSNYIPYALGIIVGRVIPNIDGLKPVHRHILYTMYKEGLTAHGKRSKSSNVVGATMKYHPNGDAAIYEALVRLTISNGSLLAPYVDNKGNFGKTYSRDMAYAAARYTEVRFSEIGADMFNGLDENAVDMLDNFDNSLKEPALLPVNYPTVLVNTSPGVAVGMASSVPPYPLHDICEATCQILEGKITNDLELLEVLKCPDFTTGGIVHDDNNSFLDILKGKGSVTISSKYHVDNGTLNFTEIPYSTSIEAIIDAVEGLVKTGKITEISDIRDSTDLNGLKISLDLKRGVNVPNFVEKLYNVTPLRSSISFTNRVIINGEPKLLSVLALLQEWIKFRLDTITRVYAFRKEKYTQQEHLLMTWEIIKDNLKEVIALLTNNDEQVIKELLCSQYGLSELQSDTLLNARIRDITADNAKKKLNQLDLIRSEIEQVNEILGNKQLIKEQIVSELRKVQKKFGTPRICEIGGEIVKYKVAKVVDTSNAIVAVTERGFIKKFKTNESFNTFLNGLGGTDTVTYKVSCRNCDDILVFTFSGKCFKIPAEKIEVSKGGGKELLVKYIPTDEQVIYITQSNDYRGSINVINSRGKGYAVDFKKISGAHSMYRSLFKHQQEDGIFWVTEESQFFLVTDDFKTKAAFCDLNEKRLQTLQTTPHYVGSFKVARIGKSSIKQLIPLSQILNLDEIDFSLYQKGYFVRLKDLLQVKNS